jgi:hypothetical protein
MDSRGETGFLSPLAAGFKVCQVCFASVYRGFLILDPCKTRVRPVYGMGYIVAKLQGYNGGNGGKLKRWKAETLRSAGATKVATKVPKGVANMRGEGEVT